MRERPCHQALEIATRLWSPEIVIEMRRLYQGRYRKQLIERNNGRCQLTHRDAIICEACHIRPHSVCDDQDKYNPDNGLLLCRDLHRLFDEYMFSINPEKEEVIFSQKALENELLNDYHYLHGMHLHLVEGNKPFLQEHYQIFLEKN